MYEDEDEEFALIVCLRGNRSIGTQNDPKATQRSRRDIEGYALVASDIAFDRWAV